MTYHILVVVSVIVRLSCVGVAVSDQVLHGAAERARDCGQTHRCYFGCNQSIALKFYYSWRKCCKLFLWPANLNPLTVPVSRHSGPTSCGVVIRQPDQSVGGAGLTVGETGSGDVVDHLVGLWRLHLHYDLTKKQQTSDLQLCVQQKKSKLAWISTERKHR